MFDLKLFDTWFNIGPLTVVVVLSLIVAIRQAIKLRKSVRNKRDDVSWRMSIAILSLLVLSLTVLFEVRLQLANATMTSMSQQISGNPSVWARCERRAGDSLNAQLTSSAHGLAYFDKGFAILDSRRCHQFMDWYSSDKTDATDDQVWAVGVLTHESVHLEGEHNEAITECKTMERYARVASEVMGAPHDEAVRMSKVYERLHLNTPREYQMDCDAYWAEQNSTDSEDEDANKNEENLDQ